MERIVGMKELRERMDYFVKAVQEKGESFIVVRRSKPLFKIIPLSQDEDRWEEVVDLTKVRKGGVDIDEVLARL